MSLGAQQTSRRPTSARARRLYGQMPSHQFSYPKVVPVASGPSPHREGGGDEKAPPKDKDKGS